MKDNLLTPLVSVICLAYNHEKYIRQCLNGFVMQQTTFPFEVLVHDDASTDKTAEIIREYEKKYPDIVKPTYQSENQFSKGVKIDGDILFSKTRGKYIAFCEGDDFWIDPLKLQKQFDALEQHPECHLCVSRVYYVPEQGNYPTKNLRPKENLPSGVISSRRFLERCMLGYPFHTSTYFLVKSDCYEFYKTDIYRKAMVGDEPILLFFGQLASVFYLADIVGCRREFSVGSWTNMTHSSSDMVDSLYENKECYLQSFDLYTGLKYHDLVERTIRALKLHLAAIRKEFKTCVASQNRRYLKYAIPNLRWRMKIYIGAYFPAILKAYDSIKSGKE